MLPLARTPVQADLAPIVVNRPVDRRPSDAAPAAPPDTGDRHTRTYRGECGGRESTVTLTVPVAVYDRYRSRPHNREQDYAQYALSEYYRLYLQEFVRLLRESGGGGSEREEIDRLIAFVQALPFTSDNLTTGYDKYPR